MARPLHALPIVVHDNTLYPSPPSIPPGHPLPTAVDIFNQLALDLPFPL